METYHIPSIHPCTNITKIYKKTVETGDLQPVNLITARLSPYCNVVCFPCPPPPPFFFLDLRMLVIDIMVAHDLHMVFIQYDYPVMKI